MSELRKVNVDKPRHSGAGRNPEQSHNWTPACAGVTTEYVVGLVS